MVSKGGKPLNVDDKKRLVILNTGQGVTWEGEWHG